MRVLVKLNTGDIACNDITCNDITYNWLYLKLILLISVNENLLNVAFINDMG